MYGLICCHRHPRVNNKVRFVATVYALAPQRRRSEVQVVRNFPSVPMLLHCGARRLDVIRCNFCDSPPIAVQISGEGRRNTNKEHFDMVRIE